MINKIGFFSIILMTVFFTISCGANVENENTNDNETVSDDNGDTGDTSNTGNTSDTGNTVSDDTGNTGDTSDTGDTSNTGNTGDTANSGDTADSGNTGSDEVTSDSDNSAPDNEKSDTELTDDFVDEVLVPDEDSEIPDNDADEDTPKIGDLVENPFIETIVDPLSTFSMPHSTATYTLVRNYIMERYFMPDKNEIRIEEMVNYFDYEFPEPAADEPFSYSMEIGTSPWTTGRDLVMIKIKGMEIDSAHNKDKNIVLLVDVSGSMKDASKLPLIQKSFKQLVSGLTSSDRVAIVSYSTTAKVVLASTSGDKKTEINSAIDSLVALGSTNVGDGLKLAYSEAKDGFIENGINRVVLATDGDFNTGLQSESELMQYIATQRQKNSIFMTVLGYGITDYKDNIMQVIADNGDGNYYYVDTEKESYRVFVQKLTSTLFTIAKDLKIQVEFNPLIVERYRLIGFETRVMEDSGFSNDAKDGGEIGAGHTVTAFFEIEKTPEASNPPSMLMNSVTFEDNEALELRIRYKKPDENFSRYLSKKLINQNNTTMSEDMGFATSVIEYAMLLRRSAYRENSSYDNVLSRAALYKGLDTWGLREEFANIVTKTKELDK